MTFLATFCAYIPTYLIEQKQTKFQSNSIELNRFLNSIDFGNRINRTRSSSWVRLPNRQYDHGQSCLKPVNSVHLVIKVEWPVSTMLSTSLINLLVDLEVGTFFVKKKKSGGGRGNSGIKMVCFAPWVYGSLLEAFVTVDAVSRPRHFNKLIYDFRL